MKGILHIQFQKIENGADKRSHTALSKLHVEQLTYAFADYIMLSYSIFESSHFFYFVTALRSLLLYTALIILVGINLNASRISGYMYLSVNTPSSRKIPWL